MTTAPNLAAPGSFSASYHLSEVDRPFGEVTFVMLEDGREDGGILSTIRFPIENWNLMNRPLRINVGIGPNPTD